MPINITGIGSRTTPLAILTEMTIIGSWCRQNKIAVRSGHAPGADIAFEDGALSYSRVFLPWRGFNNYTPLKGPSKCIEEHPNVQHLDKIVLKYYPIGFKLKPTTLLIMRRNVCQVLGWTINTGKITLSRAVVCYTNDGQDSGGTGMAMRIAKGYNIPIINMHNIAWNKAEYVIEELKLLIK